MIEWYYEYQKRVIDFSPNMPQPILVRGARQLLTLRGNEHTSGPRRGARMSELGIIHDGALLLSRGVIEHVGPTRRLENLTMAKNAKVVDATGMIVLPGFIDPDCQLVSREKNVYQSPLSVKKAEHDARRNLAQMIRCGTLSLDSVVGPGPDDVAEAKALKIHHHLQAIHPNLIPSYAPANLMSADLAKLSRQDWIQFVEFAAEGEGWNEEVAQDWRERSAHLGFLMKARARSLRSCFNLPVEQVCFEGEAGAQEIEWAAAQRWVLSASPIEELRRGRRSPQWRQMLEQGVALAIATGGSGIVGAASMQIMIALACSEMGFTIAEAITASTINAAHALGIQAIAGSLEPGKRADLLILDVPDHHEISYHLGINLVSKVILHGKIFCQQMELEWPGA